VRQHSSHVAVLFILPIAFLRLLGAAAAIRASLAATAKYAWRSHGRNRVRQRSSRVDALFLLAVASLHRVRSRSSRVAVASLRLFGAAAAFSLCFLPPAEIRSGPMAVPDRLSSSREKGYTTHHQADFRNTVLARQ
jgi:hypothetical protein